MVGWDEKMAGTGLLGMMVLEVMRWVRSTSLTRMVGMVLWTEQVVMGIDTVVASEMGRMEAAEAAGAAAVTWQALEVLLDSMVG